jgi:ferrous iron transport protein B
MVEKRTLRIALAGNPNSGKTSIFNALTGARQKVGNWPGVTVEKKVGLLSRRGYAIEIIDLPGTYSLTAFSVEERVARSFIVEEKPDVVIHVVDTGNLARNLYLTIQLMELGVDLVLDLNMWDEFEASGAKLDLEKLHRMIGAPIVTTVASRSQGIEELIDAAIDLAEDREEHHRHVPISYGPHVNDMLRDLESLLREKHVPTDGAPLRWTAIKLLERDPEVIRPFLEGNSPEAVSVTECVDRATRHIENATGSDAEKVISEGRYGYIEGALREALTAQTTDRMETSRRIDEILTNRYLGYPVFIVLMWVLFQMTFRLGAVPMTWIEAFVTWLSTSLSQVLPESMLSSLLLDGVIGGVGSVIVFLPNILILFLGVAFLEDSGYMARGAFLMDKLMHGIGLHGKSFIPMLMGFGCTVPAIMATRTLESGRDRLLTALLVPMMSCSARLPVYLLIAGTFFAGQAGTVVFALYAIGVGVALLVGRIFASTIFRSSPAPFVMELPPYRMPTAKGLIVHMWERSKIYLQKMGGIILVASVLLWFLGAFPQLPEETRSVENEIDNLRAAGTEETMAEAHRLESELRSMQVENSYIGQAGKFIKPVVEPMGFSWEMGVSLITGFVAKEVIVSTLGVLYHEGEGEGQSLQDKLRSPASGVTPLTAFAFLVFVLLYTPCIAAIVALKREVGARWMLFSIGYQTGLAWLLSFGVYKIGMALGLG